MPPNASVETIAAIAQTVQTYHIQVIGIDVGGKRKGFHAVLLSFQRIQAVFEHANPVQLVAWSLSHQPAVVAIDAPCG